MRSPPRKGIQHETKEKKGTKKTEERFDIAFFITLGIFAMFFLIVFIPAIGLLLALTLVPYIAGYQGGKYVNKKDGFLVAFLTGFIWTLIEIWILFSILKSLDLAVTPPGIYTGLDFVVVTLILLSNIMFCVVGIIYSPRKFPTEESKID